MPGSGVPGHWQSILFICMLDVCHVPGLQADLTQRVIALKICKSGESRASDNKASSPSGTRAWALEGARHTQALPETTAHRLGSTCQDLQRSQRNCSGSSSQESVSLICVQQSSREAEVTWGAGPKQCFLVWLFAVSDISFSKNLSVFHPSLYLS